MRNVIDAESLFKEISEKKRNFRKGLTFNVMSAESTPGAMMYESAPDSSNKRRKLQTLPTLTGSAVCSLPLLSIIQGKNRHERYF